MSNPTNPFAPVEATEMPDDTTQLIDGMLGAYTLSAKTHDPKHIREYDRKRVELQLRLATLAADRERLLDKLECAEHELDERDREIATVRVKLDCGDHADLAAHADTIRDDLHNLRTRLEQAERERDEARLRLSQHHGPGNAWHTDAPGDLHCRVCGIAYSAAVSGPASTSTDRVVGDG